MPKGFTRANLLRASLTTAEPPARTVYRFGCLLVVTAEGDVLWTWRMPATFELVREQIAETYAHTLAATLVHVPGGDDDRTEGR